MFGGAVWELDSDGSVDLGKGKGGSISWEEVRSGIYGSRGE